ncbi:MAG: RdgB/HAM1 family non-canonical purine NTP pyrophosphatase [Planctomycetes bacterium]|nr:RdgB/HAM1 family non-canonical purine NTP pyrophosphatase [Planctomycetota bacterium]
MVEILLATHNAGKIREIRRLAADAPLVWHGLDDFPAVPEAVEDGATFSANARKKALHFAAATGLLALADDSGLEVDCLAGAPGVHSARYAGYAHDYAANNRRLVAAVSGVAPAQRTARFRCVMALARPGEVVLETDGQIEGLIVTESRGTGGFGYDPHFLVPQFNRTLAELPPDDKNAISHRGNALRAMLIQIEQWLRGQGDWPA